jgi:3-oxocholest-4-en-26-oyl-CoA dehydrogenase alpha subunit
MDFGFTEDEQKFINEIHRFCAATPVGDLANPSEVPDDARFNFSFSFYQKVCEKGWSGLTFPREYGGLGLGNSFQVIFNEQMQSLGAPLSVTSISNNNWLANIIAQHGTEMQKQEYLTQLCRGDLLSLCQSFTEPDAGADLVSVKTRAVRDGDAFIINGQKMFSSNAHLNAKTTRLLLLARTDLEVPPEKGLSLFLIQPDLPGITLRPLWTDGGGRTNEVFFDNVRVSRHDLLGEENGLNRGWDYFREFEWGDWERAPGVFASIFAEVLKQLINYVKTTRLDGRLLSQDPSVRRKIAELAVEIEIVRLLSHKMARKQDQGGDVLGAAALESLIRDNLAVKFPDLALAILGPYGQLQNGSKHALLGGMLEEMYRLNAFCLFGLVGPLTRKNFIAEHMLDLPQYHGY